MTDQDLDVEQLRRLVEEQRARIRRLRKRAVAAEKALARLRGRRSVRAALWLVDRLSPLLGRKGETTPRKAPADRQPEQRPDTLLGTESSPVASEPPLFCPACRNSVVAFGPGPGRRPGARCPHCGALERHRFLAVLLHALSRELTSARRVLEVAPSPAVTALLATTDERFYVGLDIDPAADGRMVNLVGDLGAAPFEDSTFDLAVCFHVLEHVRDDRAAMESLARILAPTGLAFVQVPWKRSAKATDEDPDAPVEERIRRFDRADHVRMYGADFEDRMRAAGLHPVRITSGDVLSNDDMSAMGIWGVIWIVSPRPWADQRNRAIDQVIRERLGTSPIQALRS